MKDSKSFFTNNNKLNKGYLKISNPKEHDNTFYYKKFVHILPPIDLIEEYENIYPGTLTKLITMVEKEQIHRHQMDIKSVESYESFIKKGRISSIIFMIIVCITTIVLAVLEHFMIASIFIISVFLGIGIALFLSSIKLVKRLDYARR